MTITIAGLQVNILEIPTVLFMVTFLVIDLCLTGTGIKVENKKYLNTFIATFLMFICAILLSFLSAIDILSVLKSFLKWIEIFTIALMTFLFIKSCKRFQIVYWLLFVSFLIPVIFTIFEILKGDLFLFAFRIFPPFDSLYACFAIVPFVMSYKKIIVIPFALFLYLSTILSLGRAAYVGLIGVTIYLLKTIKSRKLNISFLVVLSFFFLIVVYYEPLNFLFFEQLTGRFVSGTSSNIERMAMINYALMGFLSSPIWGIGALNFPDFMLHNRLLEGMVADDLTIIAPHNFFLQVLSEEGIIGFVIIGFFFLNLYLMLFYRSNIKSGNSKFNSYLFGLRLLFLAILIDLTFGFVANQFRFNFALFLGLSLATKRIKPIVNTHKYNKAE